MNRKIIVTELNLLLSRKKYLFVKILRRIILIFLILNGKSKHCIQGVSSSYLSSDLENIQTTSEYVTTLKENIFSCEDVKRN